MITVKSLLVESGHEAWFSYEQFSLWVSLADALVANAARPIQQTAFAAYAAGRLEDFGPTSLPVVTAEAIEAEVSRIRVLPKTTYGTYSPIWGLLL